METQRLDYRTLAKGGFTALTQLEAFVHQCGPRTHLDRTRQNPRLTDQRLRVLHRHAHKGRARARRDRSTATRARGLGGELFHDAVGVGCYRIDLHPTASGDPYLDLGCWPFQIPLGAMIPVRVENLLPGGKNLGVTHITNGAFRVHPVEWNIGEAAGLLAAFCLERNESPRAVRNQRALLDDFQSLLRAQGIELAWPSPTPL